MTHQLVIMDFTGAYEQESFYKHEWFEWIDCMDIHGTKCICDDEAKAKLEERIREYGPNGIHFIDYSGNYHYMSKLWTDKINVPFVLVVFDHHPDMQPTLFGDLMSCGCWVKEVLDTNKYVQKVVIVGAADGLLKEVAPEYKDRMVAYSESSMNQKALWKEFADKHVNYPVYISIDKDVLKTEGAVTDWDSGSMSLEQLTELLSHIVYRDYVIGADICGECSDTLRLITNSEVVSINDRCNQLLLKRLYNVLSQIYH